MALDRMVQQFVKPLRRSQHKRHSLVRIRKIREELIHLAVRQTQAVQGPT
jgi:hypothetical protein